MSCLQNVWVSKCLDLYAVAQCLGGTMSGWQNVLLSKCLGVKMLGVKMSRCQKVGCPNVGELHGGRSWPPVWAALDINTATQT